MIYGLIGGSIAGAIWIAVAYFTKYELGVIAWLIGIARHKLADHWRKMQRTPTPVEDVPDQPGGDEDDPQDRPVPGPAERAAQRGSSAEEGEHQTRWTSTIVERRFDLRRPRRYAPATSPT